MSGSVSTRIARLKTFFAEFERAINERDYEKIGELYADSFISAGPNGYVTRTRDEFLAQARAASTFYESIGQTSLTITSMDEKPISACDSLVTVRWGATFRATGERLIAFDDSYVVQETGEEPKISMLIAHQDERKVLKKSGLTEIET